MDISVLGPCRVVLGDVSVVPTATKPRKVLAMLALHPDQVVSVGALMEELWGEYPPRSAATTLQTYILQIRNLIAQALRATPDEPATGAKTVLRTENGGYRLDAHGGAVDAREYEVLAASAHRAMAAGDDALASVRFREALALWRGPALVDVEVGPLLEVEAQHLDESRLSNLGQRVVADLRLGRHHEIIGELAGLSAQYPLNEGFQSHYMLALCRAGRRSTALEVYQRLRTQMRRDLGLEPSPALRRLQQAILTSDPGLDLDAVTPHHSGAALRVLQAR
jgi:DNA-binding SARP family transcriptional activator